MLISKTAGVAVSICMSLVASIGSSQLHTRDRYHLRPGDTLQLQYRLTPELNQTVSVQPDGFISINVGGEVQVGGLDVTQAHDLIVSREASQLKDPELNLILEEFTRPYVVVAGEVYKPGQFEVRDSMTALSAVMMAGGFTNPAKSGQVLVFRRVNDTIAEVRKLNLTHVTKTVDLEKDMPLEPGDIVFVPHDKVARINHYLQIANLGFNFNPLQSLP